jgi:hypothetical protein
MRPVANGGGMAKACIRMADGAERCRIDLVVFEKQVLGGKPLREPQVVQRGCEVRPDAAQQDSDARLAGIAQEVFDALHADHVRVAGPFDSNDHKRRVGFAGPPPQRRKKLLQFRRCPEEELPLQVGNDHVF